MKDKDLIKLAITKGYYCNESGEIFSKQGKLKLQLPKNGWYYKFSIRVGNKTPCIRVHRFVGYIKYGDVIFQKGIEIRHLNGNSHDNSHINIGYGTSKDNSQDIPKDERKKIARRASLKRRKYTLEIVEKIKIDRLNGMSFKAMGAKYNMTRSALNYYLCKNCKHKESI